MEISLAVAIGFVVAFSLASLIFHFEKKTLRKNFEREARTYLAQARQEQSESDRILSAIDLGIIYYDPQGQISINNQAAHDLLAQVPDNFHAFLDTYGQSNGMAAQIALGKSYSSALIPLQDRMIYISIQAVGQSPSLAHVVLVRDATRQYQEEQQRKEYVSNVSHELRTPLTTLKSYSESLIDWGIAEKQRSQILKDVQKIYDESTRMEQLIEDLNLLSSLDEASIHRYMHIELLDIAGLVKNLVDRMQGQAQERDLEMHAYVVNQVPRIYGDRNQMERIVANLITNALKYSRDQGHVDVYIGAIRDEVYVKIKDDGIGIDKDQQAKIFERFYRVDDSRARQSGGRGLGLAIVKELVDLQQGAISLESTLAVGSEFTIMFPSEKKILRQALYEFTTDGHASNALTEAAEEDLAELARSCGLVAKWNGLQGPEHQRLLRAINDLT